MSSLPLPLYSSRVPAGFPSPADDYLEATLDLNEYLVKRPAATFIARAEGNSMVNVGILDDALLIVDRSLQPQNDDVVIASVNGELTCKLLDLRARVLRAASSEYAPIPVSEDIDCQIFGVVTNVINHLCTR